MIVQIFSAHRRGKRSCHARSLILLVIALAIVVTSCAGGGEADDGDTDEPIYHRPDDNTDDGDEEDYQADGDGIAVDGDWEDAASDGDMIPDGDIPFSDGDEIDPPSDGDLEEESILPDGDDESETPDDEFCRAFSDCAPDAICNFALGRCEKRVDWPTTVVEFNDFHPRAASPGEFLVLDGANFWSNIFIVDNTAVRIGSTPAEIFLIDLSNHRLILSIPEDAEGPIEVSTDDGLILVSGEAFLQADEGELACRGDTPEATDEDGVTPEQICPYAAGYVDHANPMYRLYYPAECGSIRRPPVLGTHPLVMLLHGNGAAWINYEYLGEFLASWGFVAVMTYRDIDFTSETPTAITPEQVAVGLEIIESVRDQDLGEVHPVLSGVYTSPEIAMVGHSRGTGFAQQLYFDDEDLMAAGVGTVFLGPVDNLIVTPGNFLVFGASGDAQSMPLMVNAAYNRQPAPKWKVWINGGNHSLYTDHQVWYGFFDQQPTIDRQDQLAIVCSFTLPFMQRAFQLAEPFADQLDNPPFSLLYTIDKSL